MHYGYFIICLTCIVRIHGRTRFTKAPPVVKYAVEGRTVRLVWEYEVDNRNSEFEVNSPRWDFYGSDGSIHPIASEDSKLGWRWVLHKDTCPKRLLGRVSKEKIATLVIANATIADTGVYGCSLVLKTSSALTKKATLTITTRPHFTTKPPLKKHVQENSKLNISCSAIGSPKPTVEWVRISDKKTVIESKGLGSASLHIPNITRNQSGKYSCQARNNPQEKPVEASIEIDVLFSPEFTYRPFKTNLVIKGMDLGLNCSANGNPPPNVTWFRLDQRAKVMKSRGIGEAKLHLRNIRREDRGIYECKAFNSINEERRSVSLFTEVMVMCYCVASYNLTEMTSNVTKKDDDKQLQDSEQKDILNGGTFMIALLTVTCISVLVNILLILYICLKAYRSQYKVTQKDNATVRFGPPSSIVAKDAKSESTNDSTPTRTMTVRNANDLSDKPANALYERIPETTESFSLGKAASHSSTTPSSIENNQSSISRTNSTDIEENPPASRLQHHYQELQDFTSILNQQEYKCLDRSEAVADPHPKHAAVSAPRQYEIITLSKKAKDTEYQKLHVYANVKEVKDDKKSSK